MKRLRKLSSNADLLNKAFQGSRVNNIFIDELKNVLDDGNSNIDIIYDKINGKIADSDSRTYKAIQDYISNNKFSEDELPDENEIVNFLSERVIENINIDYK